MTKNGHEVASRLCSVNDTDVTKVKPRLGTSGFFHGIAQARLNEARLAVIHTFVKSMQG